MKTWISLLALPLVALVFAAGLAPLDAEAARLGGARSFGVQRQMTPPPQRVAPAPQQAPQAAPARPATPQAAPQPSFASRMMGPLMGLAAGLGLGWLISQGGFGSMLGTALIALLVGVVVFGVLRAMARSRQQPLAYAGGHAPSEPREPSLPGVAANEPAGTGAPVATAVPAGFDAEGFIRQAKLNFIRLQAANDARDLDTLKEVTTDEMYAAILADLAPRTGPQHTDVVNLQAQLLEVTTEGDRHWASVRFEGMIREDTQEAAAFQEVWHLQKPVSGQTGWLLAGIQQAA